eukprot:CCRYP_001046-RA/>CCRYP_001046-RA protein AED:0.28 eAED:0.28 QI:0/-1/0/1/-1/1/1/0/163
MQPPKLVCHSKGTHSKHVTFSEASTLIITRPKTQPELKMLWYSQADISRFKQETSKSATSLLEKHASTAQAYIEKSLGFYQYFEICQFGGIEHVCGIEHLLSLQVFQMILAGRALSIERVLQEQERQKMTGNNQWELIAQASMKTSFFAREWHHSIAVLNSKN